MAKKTRIGKEVKASSVPTVKSKTAVRNTAIPRVGDVVVIPPKQVTHEMIARRAYEISISGSGGGELDNWLRAEHELTNG